MAVTLAMWEADSALLPATNPPAVKYTSGSNFPWLSLAYDASTEEKAYFFSVMPQIYAAGTITVRIFWTSASTADVVWGVKFLGRVDDEVLDVAISSQSTVTDTITAANDIMVASISLSSPAVAALDWMVWEVARVAANGADDSAGDALLLAVSLSE